MARSFLVLAFVFSSLTLPQQAWSADEVPSNARFVPLANSATQVATWNTGAQQHYGIKVRDNWHIVENTSYQLKLRYAEFDPTVGSPAVPASLKLADDLQDEEPQVYIVQFVTQPIQEYRDAITGLGGTLHKFLASHAYLVRLTTIQKEQVAQLAFVRWIGNYEPAYKIDEALLPLLANNPGVMPAVRLNIMVHERGPRQKEIVAEKINAIGGLIHQNNAEGFLMEVTLDGQQLAQVLKMSEVHWVDPWSIREEDMDLAREIGGANLIESLEGFSGQGVRGEVMDSNLFENHVDFQDIPPIFHGPHAGSDSHGTSSYGVVFAAGVGDPAGRGMLPDAQGIFADFGQFSNRYTHTAEIIQSPYFGVFQSNSWGNAQTTAYTSNSFEMDDIIFINDLLITQSQSNTGSTSSRPQAWAKNVVSVGGINHSETLDKSDDFWSNASIGPAADGRIKPDLCHFYDSIYTTEDSVNGYRQFCCTSGATPIVVGHFGIFFQMWSEGIFGNDTDSSATVFENRPHATTAKAMMINTADPYPFSGTGHNLTRTHQGWGMPDLQNMHAIRNNVFVVNEELVLENLESATFSLNVGPGEDEFRATMAYLDPAGTTSSNQHRINDLTLQVTAPDGTVYWGNNGLGSGNFSSSGGTPNSIDTVENVFIDSPMEGIWTVTVTAFEINEDAHVETPSIDADFALVVSGVAETSSATPFAYAIDSGTDFAGDISDVAESNDMYLQLLPEMPDANESPLSVTIITEISNLNPNLLSLTVESNVNTPGLSQKIEVFNFSSGTFIELDEVAASLNDDTLTYSVPGVPSQFVQSSTGNVLARLSWQSTGSNLMFPWRISIDNLVWIFD